MNLHEYQAKQLFRDVGIPVPDGIVVESPDAAVAAAQQLGGAQWMVKAQVHAGGRGKAGGVKRAESHQQVFGMVSEMLGEILITEQNAPYGQPVHKVLIESPIERELEFYVGGLVDRTTDRVVFMASSSGGMDIEEMAVARPDEVYRIVIDPVVGLQSYQCRILGFKVGLKGDQLSQLCHILKSLYRLFVEKDLRLIEINPLVTNEAGRLIAVDGKINVDANALVRQHQLRELRDPSQENLREYEAEQHGLNYVSLEGNIGCMVNGAGLAMATMDMIELNGGNPANFLDVGGGITSDRVTEAFKLILEDGNVRAILVNIFGGIVQCDLIAEGVLQAIREMDVNVPIVVRLEGTHAELGHKLLEESGLGIIAVDDIAEAAQKAVAVAEG